MTRVRLSLLVVMILASLVLVGMEAQALFQQDPGTGSGKCTSYQCDWCCQKFCGCSEPGGAWHFTGWCSCSSQGCTRVCQWSPAS